MREWDEYRDIGHCCCARRWPTLFFCLGTLHALLLIALSGVVTFLVTYWEEQRGKARTDRSGAISSLHLYAIELQERSIFHFQ